MDTQSDSGAGSPADAGGVIVRDDRSDFPILLDSAKTCRLSGGRLKLVDSGKLSAVELEWLGEGGADLYTSDLARQNLQDFILMNKGAQRGDAVTAYFHHGSFGPENEVKTVSFTSLKEMGRSGVYLYVSNGRAQREFPALIELATACLKGGSRLVFYHHGPLEPALEALAGQGAWLHVAGLSIQKEEDAVFIRDCLRTAREQKSGIILHLEGSLNLSWLEDFFDAGSFVLFHTPPSDYRSAQRPFELRAKRQKFDFRTSYLFPAFML